MKNNNAAINNSIPSTHLKITFQKLTNLIQWSGLTSMAEYTSFITNICDAEEFNSYLYIFKDIQESLDHGKMRKTKIPMPLVKRILDDLGMVVFKREDSNTLSSLSYEIDNQKMRKPHEWALYIRNNGFKEVLNYKHEDESILKTSDDLITYGYETVNNIYERRTISL